MALESEFQRKTLKEIEELLPGCIVLKVERGSIQGIPDRFVLYRNKWAALEFKRDCKAVRQPNQEYYVEMLDELSFAAFIYPENKEEVLSALQRALRSRR